MKPSVVYWSNIPAPYMVERFAALARRNNITFEVWFSRRTRPDRMWRIDEAAWTFPYRYLPQMRIGREPVGVPTPILREVTPDVLVGLHGEPAFLLGWSSARMRGAATAVYVERTFDIWVKRRRWKETLKRHIFPRLDAILSPGCDGDAFAGRYGAPPHRIHRLAGFSSFPHFSAGAALSRHKRERLRDELGLRGVTFLYVGRLLPSKGLNYLVDAFGILRERTGVDVNLVIVGDGPEEGRLRERCFREKLANVEFLGFWQREDLPSLYAAADVFVFPTLGDAYGQVVEEAMSCSLPVVATTTVGEIAERIDDSVNGYIVPSADSAALLARMAVLADDPNERARMGAEAFKKVSGLTPDSWAAQFEGAISQIASARRIETPSRI